MFETLIALILSFFGLVQSEPVVLLTPVFAEVVRVVDGDTIDVLIDGDKERIRYIGIDTPESYSKGAPECYSKEASEANRELVENQTVRLESGTENTDKYNRLLRYVYIGDTFVNAELVRDGFAVTLPIKPNISHAREFKELQDEAEKDGRGLWSVCK